MQKFPAEHELAAGLEDLIQLLDDYFRTKELMRPELPLKDKVLQKIALLKQRGNELNSREIAERLLVSLNNIQSSLCHVLSNASGNPSKAASELDTEPAGVQHG